MVRGGISGARVKEGPSWELGVNCKCVDIGLCGLYIMYVGYIISGKDKNAVREVLNNDSVSSCEKLAAITCT